MKTEQLYLLYSKHFLVDTDTRTIRKNTLFFALKGAHFNGNQFAEEALSRGASYAIVDEEKYAQTPRVLVVENVLVCLQQLANYHRKQLNIPIIALTGSNGKTTTKELINAVLSQKFKTTATLGNLNNHIGVPLTLLSMNTRTEIGIVEMGANHAQEISFLATIAEPDFGYITNFGKAHLEGFGSIQGVINAKSELYDYLSKDHKTAFVNPNDALQLERTKNINRVLFNSDELQFLEVNPFVKLRFKNRTIQSNLIGKYNDTNLSAAITIGQYFKVPDDAIIAAIEQYAPQNNRSQMIRSKENTLILDAYNANPTSMEAALQSFHLLKESSKAVILGDMFELGENSVEEHQAIADLAAKLHFNQVYLVGAHFYGIKTKSHQFKTFDDFKNFLIAHPPKQQTFLIKGSRGMSLERLLAFIP